MAGENFGDSVQKLRDEDDARKEAAKARKAEAAAKKKRSDKEKATKRGSASKRKAAEKTLPKAKKPKTSEDVEMEDAEDDGLATIKEQYQARGKKARNVTSTWSHFNTQHYTRYDAANPNAGALVEETTKGDFSIYDGYTLVIGENRVDDRLFVPLHGVRVDDYTIFMLISKLPRAHLANWKADFDTKGMVKSRRYPLGVAAKEYCKVGRVDRNGKKVQKGKAGWYYLWYKGIHLLCGDEGRDKYKIRPSFEDESDCVFEFDRNYRAVDPNPPASFGEAPADKADMHTTAPSKRSKKAKASEVAADATQPTEEEERSSQLGEIANTDEVANNEESDTNPFDI